ncbi:hypothetical protein SDC9_201761 [bioreactor metagenome]|uniref:Uncharacterized protein n=1 Tax=bioreactor metagenome TaxID=1076179 RepID=A0A645ITB4_9ZZZZ
MITPSSGRLWNTVSATSPVPGGISTNMKSTSPQTTSVQKLLTMPAMTGPRQTTGSVSLSSSRLIDMISVPPRVKRGSISSLFPTAFSVTPKEWGIEGPVISASRIAVRCPRRCMAAASRLVTSDLPTPPLPEMMPMTCLTLDLALASARKSGASFLESQPAEVQPEHCPSQLLIYMITSY